MGSPRNELIGIAIVSYRSAPQLEVALASIARYASECPVAIVENSGEVERVEMLCNDHPDLNTTVVDPAGNVGYSRGVNLAVARLSQAGCSHLLIMNPDVELTTSPYDLMPYLEAVEVVSGVLAHPGEDLVIERGKIAAPNCVRPVTWTSSVVGALAGSRFVGVGKVDALEMTRVPQVAGAYMLQSLDSYLANPLNESFELYFEDVEHCERANLGRGVGVVGVQVGRHASGSSYRASGGLGYTVNRVSRARFLRRKYPRSPVAALSIPFLLEWVSRTVLHRPERIKVRSVACLMALRELRHPGTVRVLNSSLPASGGGKGDGRSLGNLGYPHDVSDAPPR